MSVAVSTEPAAGRVDVASGDDIEARDDVEARSLALARRLKAAEQAAAHTLSEATLRAYTADWARFYAFAKAHWPAEGTPALPIPADIVVAYVDAMASLEKAPGLPQYSVSTIARAVAAIRYVHVNAGHPSPTTHPQVVRRLKAARRQIGPRRPVRQVAPVRRDPLLAAIEASHTGTWPHEVGATRDRLALLMGWAGAFRRSELVVLRARDVVVMRDFEVRALLTVSKTDQEGHGTLKAYPVGEHPATCVACALWWQCRVLDAAWASGEHGIAQREDWRPRVMRVALGEKVKDRHVHTRPWPQLDPATPLFQPALRSGRLTGRPMTGDALALVVKKRLAAVGVDPREISGHSLRAGFVTEAVVAGASIEEVMAQTGHTDPATVQLYIRRAAPLERNAVTRLGL